jgi:3-hydroxy-9,10-secoandrosta-1,3,5(10)-triene-9,17-dione monooxygenase
MLYAMRSVISRKELVGRAMELAPVLAERAQRTEENRALLDDTLRDFIAADILPVLVPEAYGGHELGPNVMADIARVLSAACPSSGWVSVFYMGAGWRTQLFGERAQKEVFADKNYCLGVGQAAPLHQARRVSGGYEITGQTGWSSGSPHAEWFMFMGVVRVAEAAAEPRWFLVPREDVEVLDTWYTAGMRGTGSNDVRVEALFVPEHRSSLFLPSLVGQGPGQQVHANPMYRLPSVPFLLTEVTPVVVGQLRGAVTAFTERTRERQGTISHARAAGSQAAQQRLGRAIAAADSAETLLEAYLDRLLRHRAEQYEPADRALMKLKAAHIVDLCRNAMNDIVRGIGGDGFRERSPLQRYFRDINVLALHAFLDIDTASESFGRIALDVPVEDPLI